MHTAKQPKSQGHDNPEPTKPPPRAARCAPPPKGGRPALARVPARTYAHTRVHAHAGTRARARTRTETPDPTGSGNTTPPRGGELRPSQGRDVRPSGRTDRRGAPPPTHRRHPTPSKGVGHHPAPPGAQHARPRARTTNHATPRTHTRAEPRAHTRANNTRAHTRVYVPAQQAGTTVPHKTTSPQRVRTHTNHPRHQRGCTLSAIGRPPPTDRSFLSARLSVRPRRAERLTRDC